ncbi:hypothetical protein chiPu_0032737, partial [Chiloscyllium punctatum]|nr:hypothetical protein [Chiloscyllium punctatum]
MDIEQPHAEAVAQRRPDAARRHDHHDDCNDAEADQIPAAGQAKRPGHQLAQTEENDDAENRAFERADTADDHDEHHIDRPVDVERRQRRDEQIAHEAERTGQPASGRRQHEGDEAVVADVDADAHRGKIVVANAHQPEPEARGHHLVERRDGDQRQAAGEPEHRRLEPVEIDQL